MHLCSSSSAVVPVVARSQICAARARPTKGRCRVSGSVPGSILNAQARVTEAALAKLRDCSSRRLCQTTLCGHGLGADTQCCKDVPKIILTLQDVDTGLRCWCQA